MSDSATLIYVDLKKSRRLWPRKRPQRWFWVAKNGGNQKRLARSTETYTNKADCIEAIYALFGDGSNVYLRQAEIGNVNLRLAVNQ
jgi:hypothetical protein